MHPTQLVKETNSNNSKIKCSIKDKGCFCLSATTSWLSTCIFGCVACYGCSLSKPMWVYVFTPLSGVSCLLMTGIFIAGVVEESEGQCCCLKGRRYVLIRDPVAPIN